MYFELYFSIHKCYKFDINTCAVSQFTNPVTKPRHNLNLKTTYMYFTINQEKTQEIEGGEELDDVGNKYEKQMEFPKLCYGKEKLRRRIQPPKRFAAPNSLLMSLN